jgi:hypothetical protein
VKPVFVRLLPPRPDFVQTITATEAALMAQHAAYWKALHDAGQVVAYGLGLVADPQGFYGVGIIHFADDADVDALVHTDPTIKADVGFRIEIFPMPRAVIRS